MEYSVWNFNILSFGWEGTSETTFYLHKEEEAKKKEALFLGHAADPH